MNRALRISRSASEDLHAIWAWIAERNFAAADEAVARLEDVFLLLAETPGAGRERPELGSDLRSFPVERYVVFYRRKRSDVVIVRVLAGARDYKPEDFADPEE